MMIRTDMPTPQHVDREWVHAVISEYFPKGATPTTETGAPASLEHNTDDRKNAA